MSESTISDDVRKAIHLALSDTDKFVTQSANGSVSIDFDSIVDAAFSAVKSQVEFEKFEEAVALTEFFPGEDPSLDADFSYAIQVRKDMDKIQEASIGVVTYAEPALPSDRYDEDTDRETLAALSDKWLTIEENEKNWIIDDVVNAGFSLHAHSVSYEYVLVNDDLGSGDTFGSLRDIMAAYRKHPGGLPITRAVSDWVAVESPSERTSVRGTIRGVPNQTAYLIRDGDDSPEDAVWITPNAVNGHFFHVNSDITEIIGGGQS
jgi:hypothetical protein